MSDRRCKDGKDGTNGERGKRGHRGHCGSPGIPGQKGDKGPTGSAGNCQTLSKKLDAMDCTVSEAFSPVGGLTPLSICFKLTKTGSVNIFISLSATIKASLQSTVAEVYYQVLLNAGVVAGSRAGSRLKILNTSELIPGIAVQGNAIDLQISSLAAGSYTVSVQWKVGPGNQQACIDPANDGMHASLLIESCDGITICP